MDQFHLPGLSLVVVKDGKIVKAAAYGLSDRERRTPAAPETVYKIGSVSKQFIATGIMLLVQDGRLAVDDPISRYLDGTPPAWQPITIRHLLTHTGGIIRESPAFDPWKVQSDADVIKAAYAVPLRFPPGRSGSTATSATSRWRRSSPAFPVSRGTSSSRRRCSSRPG